MYCEATDHTDNEFQEVVEQLHELRDIKCEQERLFEDDRRRLQAEIDRLRLELRDANEQTSREQQHVAQVETELLHEQGHREKEATARHVLEECHAKALADATAYATEQAEIAAGLRQPLRNAVGDFEALKQVETERSENVVRLLSEKEELLQSLNEAHRRRETLEAEIKSARADVEQANQALRVADEDNDRRLRAQALDSDRVLRDVIAEADGDRAVLEHQCFEIQVKDVEDSRRKEEIVRSVGPMWKGLEMEARWIHWRVSMEG